MIWSIDELVKIIRCGEKVVVNNIMSELSDPQNSDFFSEENFSLLWGILGVAGIKGTDEVAQHKIWESMKENHALDAFDKGLLADFTQYIGKEVLDNRLFAWEGLDNLQADMRFKKMILMPLVKIDRSYAYQVNMQAFNPLRVIGLLDRIEINDDIKDMLVNVRGSGAACGISGEDIIDHYEKEKILMKLCEMVAFTTRNLKQHEKKFLFNYFRNAVVDGFGAEKIGLNDDVLRKLVASEDKELLSEIEKSSLYQYNWELAEFAKEIDIKDGFYEKLAAKLIDYDPTMLQSLYERCLFLMDTSQPRGCVFALELINKNKVKSAVKMLIELAKRGKATEAAIFLHRLLPKAKGSEVMIMSILRYNLKQLKKRYTSNYIEVFGEYVARMYLIGIRSFVDANLLREATVLIVELVKNGWINGVYSLEVACADLINDIIYLKIGLGGTLIPLANELNLNVYRKKGLVVLAKDEKYLEINLANRISVYEKDGVVNIEGGKKRECVILEVPEEVEEKENIETKDVDDENKEDVIDEVVVVDDGVVGEVSASLDDIESKSNEAVLSQNAEIVLKDEENKEEVVGDVEEEREEIGGVEVVNEEKNTENVEDEEVVEITQDCDVVENEIYRKETKGDENELVEFEGNKEVDKNVDEVNEEERVENIVDYVKVSDEINVLDVVVEGNEVAELSNGGVDKEGDVGLINEEILGIRDQNAGLEDLNKDEVIGENKEDNEDFSEWEEAENSEDDERKLIKNKVLNFNIKDMDEHFSKVKKIAGDIVNMAESSSEQILDNVKKRNFSNFKSVSKIRDLAKKISFKKKK